jgi:nucleotide-binding universal stress UspA family protein
VAIARVYDATLTILHVIDPQLENSQDGAVDPLDWEMRKAEAQAYLDGLDEHLQGSGVKTDLLLLEGRAAETIVACADQEGIDLVVLSSHGRSGLTRWTVSSVAQKVIMDAPASLLIIRAYQQQPATWMDVSYRRILLPLDGSQRAECVLASVGALISNYAAELLLVHVVRSPEMPRNTPLSEEEEELHTRVTSLNRRAARRYLEQIQDHLALECEIRLLHNDDAATALYDLVEQDDIDLVILGAHGYSGNNRWPYGSVATSFVIYGSKPLLLVQDLAGNQIQPSSAEEAAREKAGH